MNIDMKLPLKKSFTETFSLSANAVSILLNYPDAYPWLMNCFIQLTCWKDKYIDYYDFNYRECPILSCQRIKKEFIDAMEGGLIDFVKKALQKNYYVVLPVETKYIKEYDFEGIHEMMIYGYADSKTLYVADNFKQGKYRTSVCNVEELIHATSQIEDPQNWKNGFDGMIEMLSYREQGRARFELPRVIESIRDYLNSSATKEWYVLRAMWDADEVRNRCFGMQCYNAIFQHIQIAKEQGDFEDSGHRALFLEWEHKKIMKLRLLWMKKFYTISEDIISGYQELEEKSKMALYLKLKYDITRKKDLLDKIKSLYQVIREREEIILNYLLNILE